MKFGACGEYYNTTQDLVYENFIFRVDFGQTSIANDAIDNTLFIELQDAQDETLIGVLSIQRTTTKYSIYTNKQATIDVSASAQNTIYLGETINLAVTTDFMQDTSSAHTIYDTKYMYSKLGIQISIFDSNGNQLNSDTLFGVNFEYNGRLYYPRIDGTVRIKIADRVSNVLSRIKINTENNTTLATDTYTIRIETFGSPDGIYYGEETSDYTEKDVYIINGAYGLKVYSDNNSKIIDKTTGKKVDNSNALTFNVQYSSRLRDPNIVVELQRRDYSRELTTHYNLVDLQDYVTETLTRSTSAKSI